MIHGSTSKSLSRSRPTVGLGDTVTPVPASVNRDPGHAVTQSDSPSQTVRHTTAPAARSQHRREHEATNPRETDRQEVLSVVLVTKPPSCEGTSSFGESASILLNLKS
eukprot:GHVU01121283.1.p1 GENE.GHVU01121283.1~~GHVU01121283.1.p1  ORF type:complete len:108 (-),score=0.78 GHVU01121283.1:520-843(-)